ncbi:MAG: hypothetical protein GWP45_02420 [Proteobacteria bacterium]|nr:hypothetical protein [Pseudomonadota bacterium]
MRLYFVLLLNSLLLTAAPSFAADDAIELNLLPDSAPAEVREAESQALDVMYDFMRTFNGRDVPNFARTLTYPHVRVASGGVTVFSDRQSFIDATDLEAFAKRCNWSHSRWDSIATVQADAEKVHFAVQFTRFNPQGEAYVSFNSLYILQRTESGWGIRARSSFAP